VARRKIKRIPSKRKIIKRIPSKAYEYVVRYVHGPPGEVLNATLFRNRMERLGYTSDEAFELVRLFAESHLGELKEEMKIGEDAETGYDIFFSPEENMYIEVTEEGEVTRKEPALEVEVTYSLDCEEGHEPIYLEAHATVTLPAMSKDELEEYLKDLQTKITDYLKGQPYLDQIKSDFSEKIEERTLKIGAELRMTSGEIKKVTKAGKGREGKPPFWPISFEFEVGE